MQKHLKEKQKCMKEKASQTNRDAPEFIRIWRGWASIPTSAITLSL
jgi:ribosomal protein L39E